MAASGGQHGFAARLRLEVLIQGRWDGRTDTKKAGLLAQASQLPLVDGNVVFGPVAVNSGLPLVR